MNRRFLWLTHENKPRWITLLLLGFLAALGVVATKAYIKMAIAQTIGLALSVNLTADRHSISPDIYGVNKISTWNCDLRVYKYGFRATYPANSMTLVAIPKASS
ncbi:hypothetical protein QT979_00220 [Microcoleus sp. w2-18bC1]|uniref:hypothetical protein n=1 Tax=unclassified Microcoleus TaxID=2642155 RepID=UPI002FD0935F